MTRPAPALLLLLLATPPALAQEGPSWVLTTDTMQYCVMLTRQVEARHSPLPDVRRLLLEGRDMCERGQIRGGIRRLRRALLILHHKVAG